MLTIVVRIPLAGDELTHAQTVTLFRSMGSLFIFTNWLVPLNESAPVPTLPPDHEGAFWRVPLLPLPLESAAVEPEPSSKFQ